jgi:arsenate reductase
MPSKVVDVMYWLPHCSTCQKADAFLKELDVNVRQYVDVKTEPVDKATLEALCKKMGGVEALFSKRAMKYRQWGLDQKTLTNAEMLDYMIQEYTFIKRPVIVAGDNILAGFSQKQYQTLFKS